MQKLLTLTLLIFFCWRLSAQTPEALVRTVQANVSSLSQLKAALKEQAVYRDPHDWWWNFDRDTTGYLGHKIMGCAYRFKHRAHWKTIRQLVKLYVAYKGDQIGYVRIEDNVYPLKKVFFTYVDTTWATLLLAQYNKEHQADFSWRDLYEDNWNLFSTGRGFDEPPMGDELDSAGKFTPWYGPSEELKLCIRLVIKKDHPGIAKFSKSFNPVRKAYGAICLYALQELGEPLSIEEKQLLETIRQSEERIDYYVGCNRYPQQMIRTVLTTKKLDDIVSIVKGIIEYVM